MLQQALYAQIARYLPMLRVLRASKIDAVLFLPITPMRSQEGLLTKWRSD